jgi:hypothetical protein
MDKGGGRVNFVFTAQPQRTRGAAQLILCTRPDPNKLNGHIFVSEIGWATKRCPNAATELRGEKRHAFSR